MKKLWLGAAGLVLVVAALGCVLASRPPAADPTWGVWLHNPMGGPPEELVLVGEWQYLGFNCFAFLKHREVLCGVIAITGKS